MVPDHKKEKEDKNEIKRNNTARTKCLLSTFLQISVFSQWLFGFRKFKVLTYWTITVLDTGNDSFIPNKPVKNNDFGADSSLKTRASYF